MSDIEELQAENTELRRQVEDYRQRELADLRQRLTAAEANAAHYRSEAERNASLGRQIHAQAESEITRLRERVQSLEQIPNARLKRSR